MHVCVENPCFIYLGEAGGGEQGAVHFESNVALAHPNHRIAGCRLCTGDSCPSSFCYSGSFFLTDIQLSDIFVEISVLTDV